ncbi:MAG: SDR family NAD(P)-dependent oxidoreductase [Candidatus Hodarchaeota archaeon]
MRLKEKVAIITGAGAGIGKATANLFAFEGAKVVCNDISDSAAKVVDKISRDGGKALFVQGDVAQEDTARKIIEKTVDEFGRIDIVFNCAGIVIPGRVDDMKIEDWDRTMNVNVRSIYLLSKYAIPYLKQNKLSKPSPVIINVSSSVALKGVKERAAYTASKGAVLSMTRAMAIDYLQEGIRVNAICPGTTDTPSLAHRLAAFDDPEAARQEFIARQPMGRLGTPEEIAEGVLYLAMADFCTGISLSVDGGMTI